MTASQTRAAEDGVDYSIHDGEDALPQASEPSAPPRQIAPASTSFASQVEPPATSKAAKMRERCQDDGVKYPGRG